MSDLISRIAEAIEAETHEAWTESDADFNRGMEMAKSIVESFQSAEPKTGHVETASNGNPITPTVWAVCSECKEPIDPWDKYCRSCGAKMGGDTE